MNGGGADLTLLGAYVAFCAIATGVIAIALLEDESKNTVLALLAWTGVLALALFASALGG